MTGTLKGSSQGRKRDKSLAAALRNPAQNINPGGNLAFLTSPAASRVKPGFHPWSKNLKVNTRHHFTSTSSRYILSIIDLPSKVHPSLVIIRGRTFPLPGSYDRQETISGRPGRYLYPDGNIELSGL
jgi:hypothetical protein